MLMFAFLHIFVGKVLVYIMIVPPFLAAIAFAFINNRTNVHSFVKLKSNCIYLMQYTSPFIIQNLSA